MSESGDQVSFALEFFTWERQLWEQAEFVELIKVDGEHVRVKNSFKRDRAVLWASSYLRSHNNVGIRIVEIK